MISDMPPASTAPDPSRAATRPATVLAAMIPIVIGRNASPASSAVYPSTCCRYSETKYHMANTAAPRKKTTTLAALSVREANIRSGISGRAASRPSIVRKRASSARPTAIRPSVANEPQPLTSVRTMANVRTIRPAVTVSAPARSYSRSARGDAVPRSSSR